MTEVAGVEEKTSMEHESLSCEAGERTAELLLGEHLWGMLKCSLRLGQLQAHMMKRWGGTGGGRQAMQPSTL